MERVYSHQLRLAVCGNCGGPLEATIAGGSVQCTYCRHTSVIEARDERPDLELARRAAASAMSEADRLNLLRQQEREPLTLPSSLAPLVAAGELVPEAVQTAQAEWRQARAAIGPGAPPHEQERLFHLTRLLAQVLGGAHERAILESGVDALPDPRHRHILRCELSIRASKNGDAEAAEEWLAPCHPAPTDLHMDSPHRLAQAYLATTAGDVEKVFWLLGRAGGDVPIVAERAAEAAVLRAHALELRGDGGGAVQQLLTSMREDPRHVRAIERAVQGSGRLELCPHGYPAARERIWNEIRDSLRPAHDTSLVALAFLGLVMLAGAVICVLGILGVLIDEPPDNHGIVNLFFAMMSAMMGVFLPGVFFFLGLRGRLSTTRLRNGELGYAQVRSSQTVQTRAYATTSSSDYANRPIIDIVEATIVLEIDGRLVAIDKPLSATHPTPEGSYPCLVDPKDPNGALLWRGPAA